MTTEPLFHLLGEAKKISVDGTFRIAPSYWTQVFIVQVQTKWSAFFITHICCASHSYASSKFVVFHAKTKLHILHLWIFCSFMCRINWILGLIVKSHSLHFILTMVLSFVCPKIIWLRYCQLALLTIVELLCIWIFTGIFQCYAELYFFANSAFSCVI